jgi:hypothetical protein
VALDLRAENAPKEANICSEAGYIGLQWARIGATTIGRGAQGSVTRGGAGSPSLHSAWVDALNCRSSRWQAGGMVGKSMDPHTYPGGPLHWSGNEDCALANSFFAVRVSSGGDILSRPFAPEHTRPCTAVQHGKQAKRGSRFEGAAVQGGIAP